jgi:hypothetical protein
MTSLSRLVEPQRSPVVASVAMGYGHLRAAHALAGALGVEVMHVDRPPIAGPEEQRLWRAARRAYELTSRASQAPVIGAPIEAALGTLTRIQHLYPYRDLSSPTLEAMWLGR